MIDGYSIYPGLYLYFQVQSISVASTKLNDEFSGNELYEQELEGILVRDWIKDYTVKLAREFVFVERTFDRLGLDSRNLEMEMNYYDSSLRDEWNRTNAFYTRNGIGYATFRKAYENYVKSNQVFNALYMTEGGEQEVKDEEIIEYFQKDYTYLDYIKLSTVDDANLPLADADIDAIRNTVGVMKETAEAEVEDQGVVYVDPENVGIQAAFVFYCVMSGMTEEEALEIRGKIVTDNTVLRTSSTLYEEGFITAVFDAPYDKYQIYEAADAIYLFCRRSMLEEDENSWTEYKGTIISELRSEVYLTYVEENGAILTVTENTGARRYFSLKKATGAAT